MSDTITLDDERLWASDPRGAPFETHPCQCRTEHAPPVPWTHRHHVWPLFAGGPDTDRNTTYVCPATHDWAHVIWRVFEKEGGPVGRRRHWPHYAYDLAVLGWEAMSASDPV